MPSVRAVIFDRDGTLLRFDQAAIADLAEQVVQVASQLPRDILITRWEQWPGPWPRTVADEPSFWRSFWQPLADCYTLSPAQVAALCRLGAAYYTCFARFSDALPCVQTLHAAGIRLAMLTNFEMASVGDTLTYAGIDPAFFAVLHSSGTVGVHKPDPRAFLAVAADLQLAPDECGYVDDQVEHVLAARDLGMHAVLLDRTRTSHVLHQQVICSLEPVPQLFVPYLNDQLWFHPL